MTVFRLDTSGKVSRVEKTPQGGLRMDAALTKGDAVFSYVFEGKTVREYRPADEVARADSLATLRDAPVTNNHPVGKVTPQNYKRLSVGHVSGDVRMDGDLVVGSLAVQDASMLKAIEAGQREVSCGYACRIDEVSGVTPSGEPYDRIQRDITYNHVAIVPRGRAGRDVALRLDADGNATPEDDSMEIEQLNAKIKTLEAAVATEKTRADKAEGELTVSAAKVTELTSRADAAEGKLVCLESAKVLESVVSEARKVLGAEFKADGLDELAVKSAVAKHAFPAVDLKDKGLDFVSPLFVAAVAAPAARKDADDKAAKLRAATRGGNPQNERKDAKVDAKASAERLDKDSQEAWKAPLALSK